MQTTTIGDLELSQLMIGSAQFGMDYGIANKSGQPSYEAILDILACAYEAGVNCVDTAAGYGASEEVLGRALAELRIADEFIVATKVPPFPAEPASAQTADKIVEESVTRSLQRLRLEVLPICLLHWETDFRHIESLLKLRARGLVKHVGCSVRTPEVAATIVASGLAEVVQMPTNLLDHRFTGSGICDQAKKRGVAVVIRSIFLQGLLAMPEDEIPLYLEDVIPVRRKLQQLAQKAGMSLSELVVRYVLSVDGLTCGVVGIDSVKQMRQNVELFSQGPLDPALLDTIAEVTVGLPEKISRPDINPHLWVARA